MVNNNDFFLQTTLPGHPAKSPQSEKIPDKIGPYKIESLLSLGGMSLLYLGKHPEKNQLLAIKVLSPKFVSNPLMKEQFLKEAQIIALTDHPNIVKLYGQGEWEGGLYIAMEFIQGISLRQFIVQHSLSLKRSLDIVLQVAYALLHLHTHGVIHRDLKPENIIITENGQVKVVDFGIAQVTKSNYEGSQSGLVGTPSYMSHEMKRDQAKVSYPSDIYSLGVIAYELIIGKLSFGTIHLSYLPTHLRDIIQKALSENIEERYQDIVDFITDVSNYLKNNIFQKERSSKDELKEMLESLSQSQRTLLPLTLPPWDNVDLGLAKPPAADMLGICYDFIKLDDQSQILLIAEATSKELDCTIYIAFLKGLIRMSLHEYSINAKPFDPINFIQLLNEKLSIDAIPATFKFNLLYLKPNQNELIFIPCGFHSLWHQGNAAQKPRLITGDNPYLGESMSSVFSEVIDNWNEGDVIVMHSFNDKSYGHDLQKSIEKYAQESILENFSLSSQTMSDNILKKMLLLTPAQVDKNQKIVLSIQRID